MLKLVFALAPFLILLAIFLGIIATLIKLLIVIWSL